VLGSARKSSSRDGFQPVRRSSPICGVTLATKYVKQKPDGGASAPLYNPACVCKGIWLSSSEYSSSTDRYRLQQYGLQARINGDGIRQGVPFDPGCTTHCPVTQSNFSYGGGQVAPFQMLAKNYDPYGSQHFRLIQDSITTYPAGQVMNYSAPQDFAARAFEAIAVSTDDQNSLALSIVEAASGGCPP
jgi:hypothetical protein